MKFGEVKGDEGSWDWSTGWDEGTGEEDVTKKYIFRVWALEADTVTQGSTRQGY